MPSESLPPRETFIIQRYEPDALDGHGDWWEVRNYQGGSGSYPSDLKEAIKSAEWLVHSKYVRPDATPAGVGQLRDGFKHRVLKATVSYTVEWESDNGESE